MQAQWAKLLFVLTALESTTGMNHPADGSRKGRGPQPAEQHAATPSRRVNRPPPDNSSPPSSHREQQHRPATTSQ